jgi:hypothetical protein
MCLVCAISINNPGQTVSVLFLSPPACPYKTLSTAAHPTPCPPNQLTTTPPHNKHNQREESY